MQNLGIANLGQIGHSKGNDESSIKRMDTLAIYFDGHIKHSCSQVQEVSDGIVLGAGQAGERNFNLAAGGETVCETGNHLSRQGDFTVAEINEYVIAVGRCGRDTIHRKENRIGSGGLNGDGRTLGGFVDRTVHREEDTTPSLTDMLTLLPEPVILELPPEELPPEELPPVCVQPA